MVETILAHSATVRVLTTSREGLGVADEQLWLVPSLDVAAGIDSAAVKLYVERAQGMAQFAMATRTKRPQSSNLSTPRRDPLAIELAA